MGQSAGSGAVQGSHAGAGCALSLLWHGLHRIHKDLCPAIPWACNIRMTAWHLLTAEQTRGAMAGKQVSQEACSHEMSALACLHAGNLCQQDLSRQCALAEDDHAAVMPADTLQHKPASGTSRHASVLQCLMWRTWPSMERPVHCSCTDCLTVSLAFRNGSLPC